MKIESKKTILLLLSCLFAQSNGEISCKKGSKGKDNSELKDELTNDDFDPNSLCEIQSGWNVFTMVSYILCVFNKFICITAIQAQNAT